MKATDAIQHDAAIVVPNPKPPMKSKSPGKLVDPELSPSSEEDGGGDVASKLSDLSESSTDHGSGAPPSSRHDDMMMLDPTASLSQNKGRNSTTGSSHNKNKNKLRSERSEDYENFEKMLRNKHSKACKAMSVRLWMTPMFYFSL